MRNRRTFHPHGLAAVAVLVLLGLSPLRAASEATPARAGFAAEVGVRRIDEIIYYRDASGRERWLQRRVAHTDDYLRGLGLVVSRIAPATQDDCLGTVFVTAPGDSGGGGGGGGTKPVAPGSGTVPPSGDAAVAAQMMVPVYVTESAALGYTESVLFPDGWRVVKSWARSPGPPPGGWFPTDINWTPPGKNPGPQDCGDDEGQ